MYKLWNKGVQGTIWRYILNMYSRTDRAVRCGDTTSHKFQIDMGTAQGDTLSCTIFDIYVCNRITCHTLQQLLLLAAVYLCFEVTRARYMRDGAPWHKQAHTACVCGLSCSHVYMVDMILYIMQLHAVACDPARVQSLNGTSRDKQCVPDLVTRHLK